MITSDKLLEMIDSDSRIDKSNLDSEAIRIPSLYGKYLRVFNEVREGLKQSQQNLDNVKRMLFHYYLGKAPDKVYQERPLNIKVLKSDVDMYIKADSIFQQAEMELEKMRNMSEIVETFLKSLKDRGFNIKTALDFQKFQNGDF